MSASSGAGAGHARRADWAHWSLKVGLKIAGGEGRWEAGVGSGCAVDCGFDAVLNVLGPAGSIARRWMEPSSVVSIRETRLGANNLRRREQTCSEMRVAGRTVCRSA